MDQTAPPAIYCVSPAPADFVPDGVWEKPEWAGVPSARIDCYPWHKGGWTPCTEFKLQYSKDYLYVIFQVQDQFVRSVYTTFNGPVCRDACVEFFFQPAPERSPAYFNIETNCGGTILFNSQTARMENVAPMSEQQAALLQIARSMPPVVDPEIPDPVVWTIEYRVPLALLEKCGAVTRPGPGVKWRANLYKCAENNSHPHWGSWALVGTPKPDFHQPDYFGTLSFL